LTPLFGLFALNYAAIGGQHFGNPVKHRSGAVVSKATVSAANTATGVRRTTTIKSAGVYAFPGLAIGDYYIDITVTGFNLIGAPI
jgi:hypothetical protein